MKLRGALLLVAAATACVLSCLISPQEAAASVDAVNQWPAKPTIASNGSAASASGTFTVGTGVNRLMLVAVAAECTAAPSGVTVTYGGQALTSVVSNTAQANKIWLYRLNEAGIVAAGANKTLSVSLTGAGTVTSIYASASVYNGVDQTTPITGSNAASKTAAGTTLALSIPLTANAGLTGNTGLAVYVANWDGQTTSTPAAGYTEVRDYQGANSSLAYCLKVTTGTTTESPTSTGAAAVVAAAAGVSLNPALKLATVTTCGDCHGNPPQDGPYVTARNTPPSHIPGAHSKHSGTDEGQYALVCTVCHKNNVALNHSDGFKNITGSGVPRNTYGGVTNIANTNSPAYTQTCTKSTCHSSGRTVRQYATSPVWNGTSTCLSCHGGRNSGTGAASRSANNFSMSTSHSQHLKYLSTEINCQMCHGKTAANHTALKDYSGAMYHGNGSKNVLFNNIAYGSYTSYKSATKKCANTACHGGMSRNTWSESSAINSNHTCAHCHGIAGTTTGNTDRRAYAPGYRKTGTSTDQNTNKSDRRVGAHFVHLSSAYMKNIKCNECHKVPSTPFSADTNHTLNNLRFNSGTLDFTQASSARILIGVASGSTPAQLASFAGYTNGTAIKAATCSSVYCHGNRLKNGAAGGSYTKPYWNYSGMVVYSNPATACGRCHGNPPTSVTASHNGVTPTTGCGGCHGTVVNGSGQIINKALHIDGRVQGGGHAYPYGGSVHMPGGTGSPVANAAAPYTNCNGCHTNISAGGGYPVATGNAVLITCGNCHINYANFSGPTPGCWDCHGSSASNGMPNGATFPNLAGSHDKHVNGQSMACSACHNGGGSGTVSHGNSNGSLHTTADVNVASPTSAFIFSWSGGSGKGTCSSVACHGTAEWGVTTFNCVSCHTAAVTITKGPATGQRRAIQPEFTASWSHKASGGRTVVPADCIVCHMEGTKATGSSNSLHADGFINLRDPDLGTEITNVTFSGTPGSFSTAAGNASFSRFTRDLGVAFENDPNFATLAAVEINHCLKCHDSNGAFDANAQVPTTGTAYQPFGYAVGSTSNLGVMYIAAGNTTGAVVDVKSQFDSGNASYHPVTAKQNNSFINNSRLKAPWNTLSPNKTSASGGTTEWGFLISCWDCHADSTDAFGNTTVQISSVTAHGNGTTIRGLLNVGAGATNFCLKCHADTYNGSANHGSGSAFGSGGDSSRYTIGNCQTCHGTALNAARPIRGVDAHGFNRWSYRATGTTGDSVANALLSGASQNGHRPYAFIRTINMATVNPQAVTETTWTITGNKPGCVNNAVASPTDCDNSHGTFGPGGRY